VREWKRVNSERVEGKERQQQKRADNDKDREIKVSTTVTKTSDPTSLKEKIHYESLNILEPAPQTILRECIFSSACGLGFSTISDAETIVQSLELFNDIFIAEQQK
jgi:hypothetical protein